MIEKQHIKKLVDSLPNKPGVYQYYDKEGKILYVGKAKNLKKRVSSYFTKTNQTGKVKVLVKKIDNIKYIIVESPEDALLLENNLIKQYQPRYNAMLKDGKTYPSICITKENFPRIYKTRNINKRTGEYFGPYSSAYTLNSILDIIHKIYKIRTCNLNLTDENIKNGKFKVCLEYHIKNCKGPCVGLETKENYKEEIEEIKKIIKGDANEISKMLLLKMKEKAEEYKFEEAEELRQKYELIENYKAKSIIANTILNDTDVFGYEEDENYAFINILRIKNGSIIQGYTIEYRKNADEEKEEILSKGIVELREKLKSNSKEIIVPFEIDFKINEVKYVIPERGDRKKLLDLSVKNVKLYKLEKLKQTEKLNTGQKKVELLKKIQDKLQLKELPRTIECFDNSNIQGENAVAACVVFKDGKASKKDYRKYIIKSVIGPDDYASMREVVYRRYSKLKDEKENLPNLIIADGGIGQMESIRKVVEDELGLNIPIAGLVKNEKHRTNELLFGFPPKIVGLKINDELYKLLANIQDEVHRFAIAFHRNRRSKSQTKSELDNIKGIGEKTKKELLLHFKSVKRVRLAEKGELEKIVGNSRASTIYDYFKGEKE